MLHRIGFFVLYSVNVIFRITSGKLNLQKSDILENYFNKYEQEYDVDPNILEDSVLTAPQLLLKYGYPVETHSVQTEDGFILEMHRIPKPGARPILLMHGLLDSSSTWVIMGPNKALGYMLYDLGYDVWMGNVRGNRYSRKHKNFRPKMKEFWDFTFHEIGKFDLPVLVDTVLNKTGFDQLHYIGHSQGAAIFWILCSEHPEYNKKIMSSQVMGPVAYLKHTHSPVVIFLSTFLNSFKVLYSLIGMNEFMPNTEFLNVFANLFCKDGSMIQAICKNVIFFVAGFNKAQFNATMLPVILGHTPAGASSKQIVHLMQLKLSGRFQQYDHGLIKNKIKYGTFRPPQYDLSKTTAKVALHYSMNDWLTVPKDIERLHQQLPNAIGKFLVQDKNFNHLDFLWGLDARELLYKKLIKIIKLVENDQI